VEFVIEGWLASLISASRLFAEWLTDLYDDIDNMLHREDGDGEERGS